MYILGILHLTIYEVRTVSRPPSAVQVVSALTLIENKKYGGSGKVVVEKTEISINIKWVCLHDNIQENDKKMCLTGSRLYLCVLTLILVCRLGCFESDSQESACEDLLPGQYPFV